ncbi:hypothetical protein ACP70R_041087 [Stipagrostis hirtigluma subsp. patula]
MAAAAAATATSLLLRRHYNLQVPTSFASMPQSPPPKRSFSSQSSPPADPHLPAPSTRTQAPAAHLGRSPRLSSPGAHSWRRTTW